MDIRQLTPSDLPSVMSLETSVTACVMWEASNETDQKQLIVSGDVFGAFENNDLIAKVGFAHTDSGLEVDGLIVKESHRGRGIGRKIMTYAMTQIAVPGGQTKLYLYTHPDNSAAISLYESLGFVKTGFIADKYGPGKPRIILERKLP